MLSIDRIAQTVRSLDQTTEFGAQTFIHWALTQAANYAWKNVCLEREEDSEKPIYY